MTIPTSPARILDGKRIADELLDPCRARSASGWSGEGAAGLAVVLVGNDPASAVYVRNKRRAAEKVGIRAIDHDLPADTTDADCSRWSIGSTRTPRSTGSWSSCRCRTAAMPRT
jgi:methylenetetrahydrofolate dehydrogenase (NADP+)/methenyltetrahydrofolate cyclohydrolase